MDISTRFLSVMVLLFYNPLGWCAYPTKYDPPRVISTMQDVSQSTPVVVIHRGSWEPGFPENSEVAFIRSNITGTAVIETDVRLTKDQVPVLFHDAGLGRLTDIYSYAPEGEKRFDPFTGEGYNPKISDMPYNTVKELYLLHHPGDKPTSYRLLSVKDFYDFYYNNYLNLTVFLEIKEPKSVPLLLKMINEDTRDFYHGQGNGKQLHAKDFTVFKFNVNYFPFYSDWQKVFSDQQVPCCFYSMPSYKSNTYKDFSQKGIDITQSLSSWMSPENTTLSGVEIGLKTQGGILQDLYNQAAGKAVTGIFNAVPDLLLANPAINPVAAMEDVYDDSIYVKASYAIYDGTTGRCCYRLADLLSTWQDKKDSKDERGDPSYVVGNNTAMPAFRVVTSDKPENMLNEFNTKGFITDSPSFGTVSGINVLPVYLTAVF
ncbi:hypothetical protein F384_16905 [Citrobacter amalonaticus Y19]|uniref:GP-PDE domain-containing protein n=1 Tax=Citrobacter amalonaticus Y19 TaxID=1261127 RepID=A0A0F6TX57_CITAM|nr:glycerophosphodiester phosphodiesterase family protein [Citrobacter amalonaticus]AKE60111.1 hypothetical protein F384_16905 [Citrobacter amalonaticus Y19]